MSAALRCDGCGAFAPTSEPQSGFPTRTPLPAGWLRIYVEDRADKDAHPGLIGEVCSRACGSKWLEGADS